MRADVHRQVSVEALTEPCHLLLQVTPVLLGLPYSTASNEQQEHVVASLQPRREGLELVQYEFNASTRLLSMQSKEKFHQYCLRLLCFIVQLVLFCFIIQLVDVVQVS